MRVEPHPCARGRAGRMRPPSKQIRIRHVKLSLIVTAVIIYVQYVQAASGVATCTGSFNVEVGSRCYWDATGLPPRNWAAAQATCRAEDAEATLAVVMSQAQLTQLAAQIDVTSAPVWLDGFVQPGRELKMH